MHPYDAKRYIEWMVHQVGYVVLLAFPIGIASALIAALGDGSPYEVALLLSPLVIGIWLAFARAPEPAFLPHPETFLDDEDEDDAP